MYNTKVSLLYSYRGCALVCLLTKYIVWEYFFIDEELPTNLNLHYVSQTATLSAYPLSDTHAGDYLHVLSSNQSLSAKR